MGKKQKNRTYSKETSAPAGKKLEKKGGRTKNNRTHKRNGSDRNSKKGTRRKTLGCSAKKLDSGLLGQHQGREKGTEIGERRVGWEKQKRSRRVFGKGEPVGEKLTDLKKSGDKKGGHTQ